MEKNLVNFSYRYAGAVLTEHGKSNFNITGNFVVLANVNIVQQFTFALKNNCIISAKRHINVAVMKYYFDSITAYYL